VCETTLVFEAGQQQALEKLNTWSGRALPLASSAWEDGRLAVRLSGANAAVSAAVRELGGETMLEADAFWNGLREQRAPFFADADAGGQGLWRLALPTTAPALDLPGRQLVEWGGGQRWLRGADGLGADAIRAAASAHGGHATLFRGGDRRAGVFSPLQPALARVHQRLKDAFDPAGIFNPARMYNAF
jgi:glycolate oxidase FAD binding subunit